MGAALDEPAPADHRGLPRVALVGNPNVGKSTLFNRLTGGRARVANYPGVTVEVQRGLWRLGGQPNATVELIDLPGSYSLSAQSPEEAVVLRHLLGWSELPTPDLLLVLVDAAQPSRHLYLVMQLLELQLPMVLALVKLGSAAETSPPASLAASLGVPGVLLPAQGEGDAALAAAVLAALAQAKQAPAAGQTVAYPAALRPMVDAVALALPPAWRSNAGREAALARWALTSLQDDDELADVPQHLRQVVGQQRQAALALGVDPTLAIVGSRYQHIDALLAPRAAPPAASAKPNRRFTLDALFLHRRWGLPILALLLLAVFQAMFSWSSPAIALVEGWVASAQRLSSMLVPAGVLRELVADGLVGGVGNVLVFLPQILLLFFLLGLLEDSGIMARLAVLMDRVMHAVGGLHGRAFVPMISGFACAVPAIIATRTLERRRDRLLTMLVVPLMSCSARLPVYTLIIAALFPPARLAGALPLQATLLGAMYLFSTATALLAATVLSRTLVRGRSLPLVIELPPYRWPNLRVTTRRMLHQAGDFLRGAGGPILTFTLLMWVALAFPRSDAQHPPAIASSYAGRLGHALEPALAPLGFDWKLNIGIVGAFAAREVFVSTLGMVFGIDEADETNPSLRQRLQSERKADGSRAYTPLVGLSLMVFFALACQCMSTLAVVWRETRSWRWPLFMFAYMGALAWLASFCVYQGGKLLF